MTVLLDSDMRAIEARHRQDDVWFSGGIHDPNGYVALAHKDRGDLLARLRALRTGEAQQEDVGGCPNVLPGATCVDPDCTCNINMKGLFA